jgi:hypothetical protein
MRGRENLLMSTIIGSFLERRISGPAVLRDFREDAQDQSKSHCVSIRAYAVARVGDEEHRRHLSDL